MAKLRVKSITGEDVTAKLKDKLRIGRNHDDDINDLNTNAFLPPGLNVSVSRKHLQITNYGGGAYFVEDLGSTYGTDLNGKRLEANQPVRLKDGDVITVPSGDNRAIDFIYKE